MDRTETPNRRLDLLGFFCPVPVHETRKALKEMQEDELLEVHADDPETLQDMPALCVRIGVQLLSVKEESGEYRFLIKK
ncbi:MAG: sulfurtransferase TusA family protein [Candidatus Thalassarchaeaceae archaeon]